MDSLLDMDNLDEDATVQEAVMERFERVVTAIEDLASDVYPAPHAEFQIKSVVENLKLIHKMTGEMLQILVAAIMGEGDSNDEEPE